jgi:hypothetical protein
MANVRREDISIVLHTYKGLYVSKNAIHEYTGPVTATDENGNEKEDNKEFKGVYALIGNELKFKQVVILYTVACAQIPNIIRINKSSGSRVIIPALQVVKSRFCIIIVPTITNRVQDSKIAVGCYCVAACILY